jgi:hypothetical protein
MRSRGAVVWIGLLVIVALAGGGTYLLVGGHRSIGYQGDFAFALFVQGCESGPHVAAPLAARFLNAR